MNLTDRITLIDEAGTKHHVGAKLLAASASETQEEGLAVPLGSIRAVVAKWPIITTDWYVEFDSQRYKINAITPYLKQALPPRIVLSCEPGAPNV